MEKGLEMNTVTMAAMTRTDVLLDAETLILCLTVIPI